MTNCHKPLRQSAAVHVGVPLIECPPHLSVPIILATTTISGQVTFPVLQHCTIVCGYRLIIAVMRMHAAELLSLRLSISLHAGSYVFNARAEVFSQM